MFFEFGNEKTGVLVSAFLRDIFDGKGIAAQQLKRQANNRRAFFLVYIKKIEFFYFLLLLF